MKIILPVLLAVSITANAFLAYLLYSKPPAQAVAVPVQSPAAIQTDSDYEKIKSLCQSTIGLVHVQRVIFAGEIAEVKYRGLAMQVQALDQIDCSHCPQDFQDAWLAYVQERKDKLRNGQGTLLLAGGAALAAYLGDEPEAIALAGKSMEKSANAPRESALENLKRVVFKYKSAVPD
jgi:hypothetical protein